MRFDRTSLGVRKKNEIHSYELAGHRELLLILTAVDFIVLHRSLTVKKSLIGNLKVKKESRYLLCLLLSPCVYIYIFAL